MLGGAEKLVPAEYWCPYGTELSGVHQTMANPWLAIHEDWKQDCKWLSHSPFPSWILTMHYLLPELGWHRWNGFNSGISTIVLIHSNTDCPPKNYNIVIWVSIAKEPFFNMKNQTGLWNYDYFSTIQWRPHLIWPSSHKEIWIFIKQVIGPFLPSFVTGMYVASTGRLCSQKTGFQSYSNVMFLTT